MIKYWKITDISHVTDTISIYRKKNLYLKCPYDTNIDMSISAIYRRYFLYINQPLVTQQLMNGQYGYFVQLLSRVLRHDSLIKAEVCLY